ncbi:SDR family oxidoreductase [Belliella sp. R4-6]|uniref:dTDP-4-dehydrorhamnose reductase n=1 Tax=Belliella alkalica TaxID=1730871 RepID=A0ABS9VFP5_9BACT|nr:SDR family oxidoreductase [Belliella alkalica]MCH7414775.1 SDR family oxidoreductase [Belliella alkalica]
MVMTLSNFNKKKVLVTGANGLLGQKIVKQIITEKNLEVIPTGLGKSRLPEDLEITNWVTLDILNRDQVITQIGIIKPNFIIHTAAMTNVDQCESDKEACKALNIDAVKHLVEASKIYNCHLIHLSTDFIFDGNNGPYSEEAIPNPINFYGWTKLEAEKIIQQSKINWAIVRTVLVYGIANDMSRSNIILWVKDSLEKGKDLQLVNDQIRTPTLAEDLAAGCILIVEKRANGIYNISGKDVLTPYEMGIATAEYFGLDKTKIKETNSLSFTQDAKRPMKTGFVIEKAVTDLGYSPKSFMDGIGILAKQLKLANY